MKNIRSISKVLSSALIISTCVSCSDKIDKELATETNPYVLFKKGDETLSKRNYKDAVKYFEQIEHDHPASDLAPLAQIRKTFSLYENNKFDDAVSTINDFMNQYPTHPHADYMLYMKGLCYYDQIVDVGRDQKLSSSAIEAFDELLAMFPDSKYVKDATFKREFALNSLAGKEMEVARYYLNTDLMSAINRYKNVISYYQTSIFTPEALYRLSECYYSLGILDESKKYAAVLGNNYPKSKWYKKAYQLLNSTTPKKKKTLLQKIW
jgi:outer membrane protein assembly factor BamD